MNDQDWKAFAVVAFTFSLAVLVFAVFAGIALIVWAL